MATRIKQIRRWIQEQRDLGLTEPDLTAVALEIRRRWCPDRRFCRPDYISHSGSSQTIVCDAFAQELEGRIGALASWCTKWPITRAADRLIMACRDGWVERLGLRRE